MYNMLCPLVLWGKISHIQLKEVGNTVTVDAGVLAITKINGITKGTLKPKSVAAR